MKKKIILLLISVLFLIISCGGSKKSNETGELEGEIVFWHSFTQGPRNEFMKQAAEEFMKKASDEMIKAHEIQTDLIVKEAGGEKIDVGLIMVHSQDHLMGAILFKDLVREFIDLYKKIHDDK